LINILHPYAVLRILAQNQSNLDANVVWQYGPLVSSGWATESEFVPGARRTQTFLIATEGSSDTHILQHAFLLLRPEIADFFRFIDVTDRHPFSGAGNLLKFAEGLAKIDVHNQVIFLFDNDAEGVDTYQKVLRLSLPPNMRAILLPDMEHFRAFPARGPDGVTNSNINGRAAAIECYLDLSLEEYPPAKVIWTNYKQELDVYQGSLEFKERYVKSFLRQTVETVAAGSYDAGKLRAVLDALVAECCSIAEKGAV
jgi:HEPN/Toprim N-terminal domain 1